MPLDAVRSWLAPTIAAFAASAAMIAVALLSFSTEESGIRLHNVDLPMDIVRCTRDTDCVLVDKIGCCSCKSGGARGAINAAESDTLRFFAKRICSHEAVCVRINTCQHDLEPACERGRCMARPADG